MDRGSLRALGGPPGGDVMSIEVPTFLALAIGRDLDSRPGADACGGLSRSVGVNEAARDGIDR
jgi:hypothetical protein